MVWTRDHVVAVMSLGLLSLAGCPVKGGAGTSATTSTSVDGTTSEGSTTAGDPCADTELPRCDYCPAAMSTLCGQPCSEEGYECSNDIGDGMSCAGGLWQCVVHPPLGTGCNLVCEAAEACTEIGCNDGLTIALVPDGDGVTAGMYTVTLDLDGAVENCTLEISDDPMVCAGGPPCVPNTTCNALVGLDAMPPQITILVGVTLAAAVTVQRDVAPAVEVMEQPAYAVVSPNGPGCSPACAMATVEVAAL